MPPKEPKVSPPSPKFVDELVFLKVEDTVHCVTKSDLTQWGGVFKDMFELPMDGPECEGRSEENPIALPDCTNFQFEALMEVIAEDGILSERDLTKDQWVAILQLSTKWDMAKVRVLAIAELRKQILTTEEKVLLGSENNVTSLFVEGCASLCNRRYDLQGLEALAAGFGWDFAARIMWVVSCSNTKIPRKVGIPRPDLKCRQCGEILTMIESLEPLQSLATSEATGTRSLGANRPQPLYQPLPPPPPQWAPQQVLMPYMPQHQPRNQHMQPGKRATLLKFSCPTRGCTGVLGAGDITLTGPKGVAGGLEGLIEKSFAERMKEMY